MIAIFVSGVIILASGQPGGLTQSLTFDDAVVSIFGFCSMNFSNKAMGLVSYPFVVLSKSAKVIPVILVGALRGVYKPDMKQYCVAFFISSGLVLFNLGKVSQKSILSLIFAVIKKIKSWRVRQHFWFEFDFPKFTIWWSHSNINRQITQEKQERLCISKYVYQ